MKKSFLTIILIIVGVLVIIAIMGYSGYYPSFFPDFIKYNKFFPQVVTREVFKIENFSDPEENFSGFLKEVEQKVHEFWRKDAKFIYIGAHFVPGTNKAIVAYELPVGSKEPYCHGLLVFYNAKTKIKKSVYSVDPLYLYREHYPDFNANKTLIAIEVIELIEPYCLRGDLQKPIAEIKISGKQAFQLALIKKPELIDKYEENLWFGWLRHFSQDTQTVWKIMGEKIRIDVTTGEILEKI